MVKVLSWGCPQHAERLARHLKCRYFRLPVNGIFQGDDLIFVGMFPVEMQFLDMAQRERDPFANRTYPIFVGTDVIGMSPEMLRMTKRATQVLTVSKKLTEELAGEGVHSKAITLVPDPIEPVPLPEEFTVSIYMPDRLQFFNLPGILEVIKKCPDIKFNMFGPTEYHNPSLKNFENVGWITDKKEFYSGISANLRIPAHDGFSQSVIELAQMGRKTVCFADLPYQIRVDPESPDAVDKLAEALIELSETYEEVDQEMIDHYLKEYSVKKMVGKFRRLLRVE